MDIGRILRICAAISLFTCALCYSATTNRVIEATPTGSNAIMTPTEKQLSISKQTIHLKHEIYRAAWSPDGKFFSVIGADQQVNVFDASTYRSVHQLHFRSTGGSGDVAYSADGKYLAAGNGIISIWAAKTMALIRDIPGPFAKNKAGAYGGSNTLAFSPDSKTVATHYSGYLTEDGKRVDNISAYSVETGELKFSIKTSVGHVTTNVVFSPDGQYLIAGRSHGVTSNRQKETGERFQYFTYIDFLDAKTGKLVKSITPVHVMAPTAVAVSPDGRFVATGTGTTDKESRRNVKTDRWEFIENKDPVRLWDIESGKIAREFGPLEGGVSSLSFSLNGKYLAASFGSLHPEILWLWDLENGRLLKKVGLPTKSAGAYSCLNLAFSPDGNRIIVPVQQDLYVVKIEHK